MGRKNAKNKRAAGMVSEDDDRASVASVETDGSVISSATYDDGLQESGGGGEPAAVPVRGGDYLESLEKLSERRGSLREEGLRGMVAEMRAYTAAEQVEKNRETTLSSILALLKKAGEREGVSCAEALALFLLILGPGEDEVFNQLVEPLEFVITRGRHLEYRTQAVRALSMGCFISSTEEEVIVQVLGLLEELFLGESEGEEAPDELKAAALDGWCLLASVASPSYMTHGLRARLLLVFMEQLDSPSPELKLAAGQALAFLNEYWQEHEGFEYPEDEAELLDDIVDKLQDLAREGSKRMSRRDRKEQRRSFRDIEAAVSSNTPPEEDITFRSKTFHITSWSKLIQVEALRDLLQGGFLSHFSMNPVVHDILEIEAGTFDEPADRSIVEKGSELSKFRTCARTRNRNSRENAKRLFLESEGDEG